MELVICGIPFGKPNANDALRRVKELGFTSVQDYTYWRDFEPGALFSAQAKVAGQHGGGIRLTNEGNTFAYNFPLTANTWAACRHYGAYYGLEPVGPLTEQGVTARMFGSAAFGNRQMFHYYGNLFDRDHHPLPAAEAVRKHAPLLGERPVESGIAFFWPIDQATFRGQMDEKVTDALLYIRNQYHVSPVNEEMILDGVLKDHRSLIMVGAASTRAPVLAAIAHWVREKGGRLLAVDRCRDLELEPVREFDAVFGIGPDSEDAWGHASQAMHAPEGFDRLRKISQIHSEHGWLHLAEDVERIALAVERPNKGGTKVHAVSSLFRRGHEGGGEGIFYCGPLALKRDPQAMFADGGTFAALLDDICAMSGIRPLGTQEEELSRARIDGEVLVLREDGIRSADRES